MDFKLPTEVEALRVRVAAFVRDRIVPLEADRANYDEHENIRVDVLDRMRAEVKAAGLWAPQVPKELGGLGLDVVARAALYEEMNWSIFGPACFNAAAPDDGNMTVLAKVATPAQKARWLRADRRRPRALGVRDDRAASRRRLRSVDDADARGAPRRPLGRARAQVVHHRRRGRAALHPDREDRRRSAPRACPRSCSTATSRAGASCGASRSWDPRSTAATASSKFDGLEIPDDARLMEVGDGLKVTQIRLGTARLTHCMRWTASRNARSRSRSTTCRCGRATAARWRRSTACRACSGRRRCSVEIGRLLTMRAAAKLDAGDFARKEISMAKVVVADALQRAVDTGIQLNGARGIPRTRCSSGSTATRGRRAWSTARRKCTRACWPDSCSRSATRSGGGTSVPAQSSVKPAMLFDIWPHDGCDASMVAANAFSLVSRLRSVKVPLGPSAQT